MDQQKLTFNQLMILSMLFDHAKKTADIATELSMTKQGILYHLKVLRGKGLIGEDDRITREGFEVLHRGLSGLRTYLTDNISKLDIAMTWEAIADDSFSAGDTAYLAMKDGYLHASGKKARTASGRATNKASRGQLLLVTGIKGIIDMEIGEVTFRIVRVNDDAEASATEGAGDGSINGIIGEGARVYCTKNSIRVDVEYGSLEAAFDASTRGKNSTVYVSDRRFQFILPRIGELSKIYPGVSYSIEYL